MSKRGIEAVREEKQYDPQNFIFRDLLDELYANHIYPSLDATTLVAMLSTSHRFRKLGTPLPPVVCQRQIERYFPTSKEVFPEEFEKTPYQLFLKEYKRYQAIKNVVPNLSMISVLAALNGEMTEIDKVQGDDKSFLLTLMLSNGYFSVLELLKNYDDETEKMILFSAATFAAMAGNKVVFDRLIQRIPTATDLDRGEFYKSFCMLPLTTGRIEMAKYLMEKYIQPLRLTPEQNRQFLNETATMLFSSRIDYKKNRSLASVQYLCSFKDDAGRPIVAMDILKRVILDYAVQEGDLEIVKFILSLEDNEHNLIFSEDQLLNPDGFFSPQGLLTHAARNNQGEMFQYIFQTYNPEIDPDILRTMMGESARHPSPSYNIVQFINELRGADGKYIISVHTWNETVGAGISAGKYAMVQYLLSDKSMEGEFDFNELISRWFEIEDPMSRRPSREKEIIAQNDILTLQVILNSIPSGEMLKSAYCTLIEKAFKFYKADASKFFDLLSKIKDPENKPYSLKKEFMMDVMLLLPFKAIQHQCVTDFIKSLTDDEFNQIKAAATLYNRSDIVDHVQAVRHQENQMSSEVSVISANPESEPPAKRARFTF